MNASKNVSIKNNEKEDKVYQLMDPLSVKHFCWHEPGLKLTKKCKILGTAYNEVSHKWTNTKP